MTINKITKAEYIPDNLKSNKVKTGSKSESVSKDKLTLSEEAQSLLNAEETKKIDEIRKKIDDGFYQKPEVINKVVDGLMKDLKKD